jgi:hypothetical protein
MRERRGVCEQTKKTDEGRESDRVMIARYLCAQHSLAAHEGMARQTRKVKNTHLLWIRIHWFLCFLHIMNSSCCLFATS